MDCRGFESGETMNEYMIAQWNSRVRKRDEVVILGDFCISKKGEVANAILERLNGKKYLIIGNHDHFIANKQFDPSHFEWITRYFGSRPYPSNRKQPVPPDMPLRALSTPHIPDA